MQNILLHTRLVFLFLIASFSAIGQARDTIRIDFKEILIVSDTIYYGSQDSVIILDKETDYHIEQNKFLRDKEHYDKNPEKKENIEEPQKKYKDLLLEQITNTKVIIPKGFNPSDKYFESYEGKIIKNIFYNQVRVLDGSVYDTAQTTTSSFGRFLDKTHAPTNKKALEYNVRFKKYDRINARIFSDNERILRNLPYIEEAKIYVVPVGKDPDSVNIMVVTKDKFPIGISVDVNDYNYFEVEPYTRNFLGMGHRIGANFIYKGDADQQFGYGLSYLDDNVFGTFTKGTIGYLNSHREENFYIRLDKPFVSTDTKFGGEVGYEILSTNRILAHFLPDSVLETNVCFTVRSFDTWLGYSIFVRSDITKPFFNVAGRYYSEVYSEHPEIDPESNFYFHDKYMNLGAISYQQVSFLETSKLLSFGSIEYVPMGFNIGVTTGWQKTSYYKRPYAGFHINYSRLLKKAGIFALLAEVGGYHRNSKIEDGVMNVKFTYFSPLIPVSRFELRNIFSFTFNGLVNPLYLNKITFDGGVRDFEETDLYGNGTLLVRYQPIFYSPYEVSGFNFAFKPFMDLGWISESKFFDSPKHFYSVYGIGASIKNESLIFPAMNVYAGYHPNRPGGKSKFGFEVVFKDYKILNFFAELKPKTAHPQDFYW